MHAAFTKNGMKVSLTPCSFSTFSLHSLAQRVDRRHVDFVERREMRRRVLRLKQILGDALSARRHLLARLALAAAPRRLPLEAADSAGVGAVVGLRGEHVGLDTTPPRPVPATAAMSMPRSSAIFRAAGDDFVPWDWVGAGCGGDGRDAGGAGVRFAGWDDSAAAGADAAAAGAAAVAPAVAGTAVSSISPSTSSTWTTSPSAFNRLVRTPGFESRDFHRDLVGLELDEGIARGNDVAFLLQPARDGGFDDGLTERGDLYGKHSD